MQITALLNLRKYSLSNLINLPVGDLAKKIWREKKPYRIISEAGITYSFFHGKHSYALYRSTTDDIAHKPIAGKEDAFIFRPKDEQAIKFVGRRNDTIEYVLPSGQNVKKLAIDFFRVKEKNEEGTLTEDKYDAIFDTITSYTSKKTLTVLEGKVLIGSQVLPDVSGISCPVPANDVINEDEEEK